MLYEFITSNREFLIARCQKNVAERSGPSDCWVVTPRGVPLFLEQLVDILHREQLTSARATCQPGTVPGLSDVSRAAALHGTEMLRLGFTVDQVVREYGDVCQAITQLAVERETEITADEFRTLNRCLDDAIADAVSSFGYGRQVAITDRTDDLQARLEMFMAEQARLVETATQAFSAIKTGGVGTNGATGQLLGHTLTELRYSTERTLPQIHLAFEKSAHATRHAKVAPTKQ